MRLASAPVERAVAPAAPWAVLAEGAVLVAVLAAAAGLRLAGLANDTDISDEGIRGLQLRLMGAGFRPVSEIYASQGPLSLTLFYPLYRLFGADIVAARLAVVVYGVAGVLVVYWLGRRLGGPVAGLAGAAILAISPVYLENSRLAFVEVPSLAPTLLALAALLRYRDGGGCRWLVGSAVLMAIGVLAKPMAAVAAPAAFVLLAARRSDDRRRTVDDGPMTNHGGRPTTDDRRPTTGDGAARPAAERVVGGPWSVVGRRSFITGPWSALVVYGAVGLAVVGAVVLLAGPAQVFEQMVGYRVGARAARGWDLAANWGVLRAELVREGVGLLALAGLGAAALGRRRPVEAAAVLLWLGSGFLVLLLYSPLWPKHVVYVLPPLALLAGAAVGELARSRAGVARWSRPRPLVVGSVAAAGLYLASLPAVAQQDRRVLARGAGEDAERYADDPRVIAAATAPDDFIVMDDAYLALGTGRLVPPPLADLSWNRIMAGALSAERAISETRRFEVRALVIQDDHLGRLPRYIAWADREYLLVKSYVQRRPNRFRRVYLRPDADRPAARAALAAGLQTPLRAEIGPAVLLGYSVDRRDAKTGSRFALTLHWEALVDAPPEHHLVVRLRGADGWPAHESTWRVGDGAQELSTWSAGRWQLQTIRPLVEDSVRPGPYTLTLALEPPRGPPADVRPGVGATATPSGSELDLGTVTIR